MDTSAVVFLFDAAADGVSSWYGREYDTAFLNALSGSDPTGLTSTIVARGDAIVDVLARKVTAVEGTGRGMKHTQSADMELYRTIIWDLADALTGQWNTVDPYTFPLTLGRKSVHCICTPTIPGEIAAGVDSRLRGVSGYLGAIELDLGNPIQWTIFYEYLIKDAVVANGTVVLELSWEGDPQSYFGNAKDFQPNGERWVPYGSLDALRPSIPIPPGLSPRGALSLERFKGKQRFSVQERVAAALVYGLSDRKRDPLFSIATSADPSNPLEANLPESKFLKYLLDEFHPKGGSKAKFFADALGIGPDDWRYLAAQLHDGLLSSELVEVEVKTFADSFGISFNAVIPVRGLNGRTIDIDTNWIMEPGLQPRLSTAVPTKPRDATAREGREPPIVSKALEGAARWEAIYRLAAAAGEQAATDAVPTPMRVGGGREVIMEGLGGHAWVRVLDARRGFARWIVASGFGMKDYRSGVLIFANVNSQSIDRATAYANAFGAVLRHNGIECQVESRLD